MYFPTKRPITLDDIQEHLDGTKTLGAYCLTPDNMVSWACNDLDGDDLPSLKMQGKLIYDSFNGFPRIFEFSGRRGYHVWIFFRPRVTADYAQKLVKARINRLGLGGHEVFPKQTELTEFRKYGNLVKLPCGIHNLTGKRSDIIEMEGIR